MKEIKVLVACETSGAIRKGLEFYANKVGLPISVTSIDVLDSDDGVANHVKQNFFDHIKTTDYDYMFAHPPCTHLTTTGARWDKQSYIDKESGQKVPGKTFSGKKMDGIVFFVEMYFAKIPRVALENPGNIMGNLQEHLQKKFFPAINGTEEEKEEYAKKQIEQARQKYGIENSVDTIWENIKKFGGLFNTKTNKINNKMVNSDMKIFSYHPWMFGHDESKYTRWWTRGMSFKYVTPEITNWKDRYDTRPIAVVHQKTSDWKARSETLVGVANALCRGWIREMAEQNKFPLSQPQIDILSGVEKTERDLEAFLQNKERKLKYNFESVEDDSFEDGILDYFTER